MKRLFSFLAILTILQATAQKDSGFIKVGGEVTTPLKLYASDLAAMPRATVNLRDHDGKDHPYSGVPVVAILNKAGVTTGKQLRGKNLAKYLLVKCADGYEVLFSLAELDSAFNDRTVILADQTEGHGLPPGKGPFRIIVPDEKRPARSSFQVTEFIIRFAKD